MRDGRGSCVLPPKEIELTRGLCSLLAESFLLAEARMPFRSYKSAEFSVSRRYY
jgi:hypothetical protein